MLLPLNLIKKQLLAADDRNAVGCDYAQSELRVQVGISVDAVEDFWIALVNCHPLVKKLLGSQLLIRRALLYFVLD